MSPHDHRPPALGGGARENRLRTSSAAAWLAMGIVLAATGLVVGVPTVATIVQVLTRFMEDPVERWHSARSALSPQILVNTGIYALLIALLAVMLAWPAAWLLAGDPSSRRSSAGPRTRTTLRTIAPALIATPLLLPSYLTYAGWGLLRGPNTGVGDWLARQDPSLTIWVGKATAVVGMALWVWPLAAFVLAGFVRASAAGLVELAALDAPSFTRRAAILVGSTRSGIGAAAGTVALVMLGSAIPLHVAQVPTFAIELWRVMQLTPDQTGVWIAATPLLAIALVAAVLLTRRVARWHERPIDPGVPPNLNGRAAAVGVSVVWAATVLAPLALFLWSLGSWHSIPQFWRISGAGVAQSLRVAAGVGGFAALLIICTWAAVDLGGRFGRGAAAFALSAFLFAGLTPGALVGTAVAGSWGRLSLDELGLGATIVVLAHLARFGFLAVLAGWWLSRVQGREQRWLLELDGGRSVRAWLQGSVLPLMPNIAGVGMAIGALSLHEIESTVFVLPPGIANLPQQVLDYLHYARDEQLSAAAVNLFGLGIVGAFVGAALVLRASGRNLQRGGADTGSLD